MKSDVYKDHHTLSGVLVDTAGPRWEEAEFMLPENFWQVPRDWSKVTPRAGARAQGRWWSQQYFCGVIDNIAGRVACLAHGRQTQDQSPVTP